MYICHKRAYNVHSEFIFGANVLKRYLTPPNFKRNVRFQKKKEQCITIMFVHNSFDTLPTLRIAPFRSAIKMI